MVQEEQPLVQLVVKGCMTSEGGGETSSRARKQPVTEWSPFPLGYMECGGFEECFGTNSHKILHGLPTSLDRLTHARLCISATVTKQQTVYRLMLL